jgi:hypothetical protein
MKKKPKRTLESLSRTIAGHTRWINSFARVIAIHANDIRRAKGQIANDSAAIEQIIQDHRGLQARLSCIEDRLSRRRARRKRTR